MNMNPKVRPLWQRLLLMVGTFVLMVYKATHLPRFVLPRDVRSVVTNWEYAMFWMLLKSRFTKAYIDQPCYFKKRKVIESKAHVAPEYRLSQQELESFYDKGYLGPYDAFSPEEMRDFEKDLRAMEHSVSETYGFVTPRDRHFESPRLWNYFKHPAITERLAQILGSDLLVWRSQIFYKDAGFPAIQWHQASTFMVEDYQDPAIYPADRSEIFQLTVWIAVDDATPENGCMQFANGTHDSMRPIKFGGDVGFYNTNFTLEFDQNAQELVDVPVRAGQFLLFTERCIHGSAANNSDQNRLAFNMRVIPTSVPVYTNKKYYRSVYNGGKYFLDKWGVSVLRGKDNYRLSRTIPAESLEQGNFTEVLCPAA